MTTGIPSALIALLEDEPTPQESFPWIRQPWLEQMHDRPEVLAILGQLPDRVDRQTIREAAMSELTSGRVLSAFVPAMVWGWGTTSGRGALRTRWILTETVDRSVPPASLPVLPSVSDRLEDAVQSARQAGAEEAYRLLNNEGAIKHFGRSYFTKWLYFVSAQESPDDPKAAPILDDKIAGWLANEASVLLDKKTASYAKYLDLLACWGQPYGRSRVQVEKAIFKLATGRG
ncbi:8-oxoguanine DNA glycosylase OGG fold protein [Arthrobacter globiformis]|uniref:Uncharacterized protein n=1 Tax=Arthrobacter globiformis TaxID=1665 RepID=A0A328HI83_ARTGO|nr:hypothetical protein [Arthrobacter globiformis]RAM38328.1 hypothetical protein DBZ45_04785 [Arthrobacter globiformis]